MGVDLIQRLLRRSLRSRPATATMVHTFGRLLVSLLHICPSFRNLESVCCKMCSSLTRPRLHSLGDLENPFLKCGLSVPPPLTLKLAFASPPTPFTLLPVEQLLWSRQATI